MKNLQFLVSTLMIISVIGSARAQRSDSELENMLVQDCGSCHGLTMRGGLGPPLTYSAIRFKPRNFLIDTVLEGRAGTAMPPWKILLSREEATWMVDRLLSADVTREKQ
jgi:cytochrome c55X